MRKNREKSMAVTVTVTVACVCVALIVLPQAFAIRYTGVVPANPPVKEIVGWSANLKGTFDANAAGVAVTHEWYFKCIDGVCGGTWAHIPEVSGLDEIQANFTYPGKRQYRHDVTYQADPDEPPIDPTSFPSPVFNIAKPDTEILDRGPVEVMEANVGFPPINWLYYHFQWKCGNEFVYMDATTSAEEKLDYTFPNVFSTGWTSADPATFNFYVDTISDSKTVGVNPAGFDAAPDETLLQEFTQTNRLVYRDCCGTFKKDIVGPTRHFQVRKYIDPAEPTKRKVKYLILED